ncbi:hypothetical protein [Noviherbaspirillum saxi]|uniref:hypothetical protein n=1 Tax=Noviherbaspirillum saxi TaxID=2320863 RepID=UPI0011C427FD|nr:hypothetical protein [Noviherbaspirillum saxi]
MCASDEMIESMVASLSEEASDTDRRMFKHALRQLVKVAREEQLEAIQNDFDAVYNVLRVR